MGTKNNPGPPEHDCYLKADPNEPMFTLLGRDPIAASLVLLWAAVRVGDCRMALRRLIDAFVRMENSGKPLLSAEERRDIAKIAGQMGVWYRSLRDEQMPASTPAAQAEASGNRVTSYDDVLRLARRSLINDDERARLAASLINESDDSSVVHHFFNCLRPFAILNLFDEVDDRRTGP